MGTRIGSFRGVARMWLHFSALALTLKLTKLQPLVTFTIIGLQNYHLNGYHPNHRVAALQYSAQYNMISPRRQRTRVMHSVSHAFKRLQMHTYIHTQIQSQTMYQQAQASVPSLGFPILMLLVSMSPNSCTGACGTVHSQCPHFFSP